MKKTIFDGVATALVTPMHEDFSVNYAMLDDLIQFQIAGGADALVIAGTTGEGATLTDDEQIDVIRYAVQCAKGRVPVVAGAGSHCTAHAVQMAQACEKVGADALLEVTPYYNKASQEGLFLHFQAIAQATALPMMLYNVPSRTGVNIAPEIDARLSQIDNIVAIKEASGNIAQVAKVIALCGDALAVYAGNDDQITASMALGAHGAVSVLSNLVPGDVHKMCTVCNSSGLQESAALQLRALELIEALFCEVNPIPVKCALQKMGWDVGPCRLPLSPMSPALQTRLHTALAQYGLCDAPADTAGV